MNEVTIEIVRLRLYCHHGVMNQERMVGNTFEVSVSLNYPAGASIESDRICDTLNYADVVDVIKLEMNKPSQLLEHAAARIKNALCENWPSITSGIVRVAKLTPPISAQMKEVAVTVRW